MPPIRLEGEGFQGVIKGTIPEEKGIFPLEKGGTVEIPKLRRNGRGPNGNRHRIKAAFIRIPVLSPTGKWVRLDKGAVTFKLPKNETTVTAKII